MPDSPSSSAGVGRAQTVEGGGGGLFCWPSSLRWPRRTKEEEEERMGGRSLGGGFCGNVEYVYTQGERIISGVFPLFSLGKMMCGMRRSLPREDEKEAVRRRGEER